MASVERGVEEQVVKQNHSEREERLVSWFSI